MLLQGFGFTWEPSPTWAPEYRCVVWRAFQWQQKSRTEEHTGCAKEERKIEKIFLIFRSLKSQRNIWSRFDDRRALLKSIKNVWLKTGMSNNESVYSRGGTKPDKESSWVSTCWSSTRGFGNRVSRAEGGVLSSLMQQSSAGTPRMGNRGTRRAQSGSCSLLWRAKWLLFFQDSFKPQI